MKHLHLGLLVLTLYSALAGCVSDNPWKIQGSVPFDGNLVYSN